MSETTAPTKRPGRLLRVALVISIALNLAVAGLVVGSAVKFRGERPVPLRDLGFGAFTDVMTKEQRARLRQAFFAQAPDFKDLRRQMQSDRSAVLDSLRAQPFDPAAFGHALAAMNARHAARTGYGEVLLRDLVTSMSNEERAAFVDRLQAEMERPAGKSHGQSGRAQGN